MKREFLVSLGLICLGIAGVGGTYMAFETREGFAERPQATGDIGFLFVYAQTPEGPMPLQPDRLRRLKRPQDFAFHFVAGGSGPRSVRLELESGTDRSVMFEERLHASPNGAIQPLDYVMHLGEQSPNDVALIVTVESPHAMSAVSRYPIQLIGKDTMYWLKDHDGSMTNK